MIRLFFTQPSDAIKPLFTNNTNNWYEIKRLYYSEPPHKAN